jgi:hypothetical protein
LYLQEEEEEEEIVLKNKDFATMSESKTTEAHVQEEPTHTSKDVLFTSAHESEEDKRRRHLAELTADSDVKAPGFWQRFKEEIQAIAQNMYEKIRRPKSKRRSSSA